MTAHDEPKGIIKPEDMPVPFEIAWYGAIREIEIREETIDEYLMWDYDTTPPEGYKLSERKAVDEIMEEEYPQEWIFECSMCGKECPSVDEKGMCSSCRQVWNG